MIKQRLFFRVTRIALIAVLIVVIIVFLLFVITTPVTQNLDSYEYELPFKKGASFRIVQGYGGLFTHRYTAALDFAMPSGTPIYAARDGTIYRYKDDSDEGGPFPSYKRKANYIIIQHDDGSFGCYWHLKKNGVVVKQGRVSKGDLIGFSGATGQVLTPHLHFSVKRALNYDMNSFVRTKFRTTEGVILLKVGRSYTRPAE